MDNPILLILSLILIAVIAVFLFLLSSNSFTEAIDKGEAWIKGLFADNLKDNDNEDYDDFKDPTIGIETYMGDYQNDDYF